MTKRIEIPLDPGLWEEYYHDKKIEAITKKQIKYTMDITGVDYDTLKAEADYLFIKACLAYKEFSKRSRKYKYASFGTFYYKVLHNGFYDYRTRRGPLKHDDPSTRVYGTNVPEDEREFVDTLPDRLSVREYGMVDFFLSLTSDEKYLVNIVMNNLNLASRQHLWQLVVQRGKWDEERYWKAFNHIQEMLYN